MQISHDSDSLKRVREFFMTGAGTGVVTEGGESILEFQRFLETGDTSILDAIRDYNAEDCQSTRLLLDWLLERKAEAEQQFATTIPWYVKSSGADKAPEERDENRDLRERLRALANQNDPNVWNENDSNDSNLSDESNDDAQTAKLLAHLLDYHQRE